MWWRRFAYRRALVRHPVSLTRQRTGFFILVVLALILAWYAFITRDHAIRSRAIQFLTDATSGEVEVRQAEFHLFDGITLRNVRISTRYEENLDPAARESAAREIFSAASLKLVHNPWLLLFGKLQVEQIVATRPIITLVHNFDTGMRNWQLLSGPNAATSRQGQARPSIVIRGAKAVSVGVYADGRRDRGEEELDADVHPSPQSESGYCIEVRRFSQPGERATVLFDPAERIVRNTPFVDARTVRLQLPLEVKEFFARIALEGEVKLNRMKYEGLDSPDRNTEIQLRHVRCRIPLAMLRSGDAEPLIAADLVTSAPASGDVAVQMEGVRGEIKLRGQRLEVDIYGRINHARCHVKGTVTGSELAPDQMGIDLTIEAERLQAPEGEFRHRLVAEPGVPEVLQAVLADYDPHGQFDLALRVQRSPGPAQPVTLTGHFASLGATGTAQGFPYRVDDLYGCIRFEPPNIIVEDLIGRRGSALIHTDAFIEQGHEWFDIVVAINAIDVALDSALFDVLPERYRAVWEKFNPQGWANLIVRTTRPSSEEVEPEPPWTTLVTADLVGAHLLYTDFPYPLDDVTGRLHISGDEIRIENLMGRHGDGVVHFEGTARLAEDQPADAEIRVTARGVRMDDSLASALPSDGRGAFEQFQPEGLFDLSGTIRVEPTGGDVFYDLTAKLCDAAIRYVGFPYSITGVQGEIRISPDRVSIIDVAGRHGPSRVLARGSVHRMTNGYEADLYFEADELVLDEELYAALPPSLRRVWSLLEPSGTLRTQTALRQQAADGVTHQLHRSRISATNAALTFKGFPWPLTDVTAEVVATEQDVEILSLHGWNGEAQLRVSGKIELGTPGYRGSLIVRADGLKADDALMAALPEKLRATITSIAPTGSFAVELNPLMFDLDEAGLGQWDATCRIELHGAALDLGFAAEQLNGELTGRVVVDRSGSVSMDCEARLKTARLAGWDLEDATARITRKAGTKEVQVQDVVARAYGGDAIGSAEIRMREGHSTYQASIYVRDVALASFVESLGGGADSTAGGLIRGNLMLQGRSGTGGYREGAGELFIQHAQVWRMPIVFAIFQVLNLAPDENVFHDGWLKYHLSQDTLTFSKIDLQGKAMSFIGGGRMDLVTKQLDVTLLAGSPVRLRLPLLTDLLEGAWRELMEVRLRGTLQDPDIQPQPLKSLAKALQTIFPEPPPRSDGRAPPGTAG